MGLGYVCVCVCVAPCYCKIHDNTKKGFFVDMMDVGGLDFVQGFENWQGTCKLQTVHLVVGFCWFKNVETQGFRDCWLKSWSFIFKFYIDDCCDNNQYLCDHSVWFEPFHVENVFSLRCVCVCLFLLHVTKPPEGFEFQRLMRPFEEKKTTKTLPHF